jgi:c-di-GMP-binding flagellar brake protein YcgR
MPGMTEQERRFPRLASHLSVLVRDAAEGGVEELAHTRTISNGGCSFVSDEQIAQGARLEILIAVEREVVRAHARAVYARPLADGRNEVGVEFLDLDDEAARKIEGLFEKGES